MTIRDTIAEILSPSMAREAMRYRYMRDQIKTEIWWLAEFPDVRDTLQRLLDIDRNFWRAADEPYSGDLPSSIVDFREMLRRRSSPAANGAPHPLAKFKDPRVAAHGLYRIHWKSGGTSLAAIGSMSNGNRWIAPTNWLAPSTDPSSSSWAEIERLERIDPDALERQVAELQAELDLLQDIIDSRPAINAGLPETYINWSQSIYSGDAARAITGGSKA
jgi:hypothetical protein